MIVWIHSYRLLLQLIQLKIKENQFGNLWQVQLMEKHILKKFVLDVKIE